MARNWNERESNELFAFNFLSEPFQKKFHFKKSVVGQIFNNKWDFRRWEGIRCSCINDSVDDFSQPKRKQQNHSLNISTVMQNGWKQTLNLDPIFDFFRILLTLLTEIISSANAANEWKSIDMLNKIKIAHFS